jgi:hypothetical protein
MSDRQARRQDIARTVHELGALVTRLHEYQRTDPAAVASERADLLRATDGLIELLALIARGT